MNKNKKLVSGNSLVKCAFTSVAALGLVSGASAAIVTNVSTVAELVGAIEYLNVKKNAANTIVLAKGTYDVSDCFMQYSAETGLTEKRNSHLAINYVTLKGATDNPRDTVICGGGEAKGHGVICGAFSRVYNLTISNGWNATRSGGGYAGYYSAGSGGYMRETVSNCVVTCNYSDANWEGGSGIGSGAKVYDSEISFNRTGTRNCFGAVHNCDLYHCFIHSNTSGTRGGGLGNCMAYDCIISNNTAATWGGGMGLNNGNYLLDHCIVVDNHANESGGAVSPGSGTGMVTNTLIVGNTAVSSGGGTFCATCYDCIISNNSVTANSNNSASGAGAFGGKLTRCDVCFNYIPARDNVTSGSSYGAGANSSVMTGCHVYGNAIFCGGKNRQGAGLYGCCATNCVIYDNYTVGSSAGVAMNSGSAYKCVFSNNQANVTWSSAHIRQPTGPIVGCEFYGQSIECSSVVLIENCHFHGYTDNWCIPAGHNVASPDADLSGTAPVTPYMLSSFIHARNCLFENNSIDYFCKAYKKNCTTLENCTIADNRFTRMFDGFDGQTATSNAASIVNCLFSRNYNRAGTTRCDFKLSNGNNASLVNCLMGADRGSDLPASETGTVIANNARFNDGSAGDPYEIRRASRARGKGVVLDWMTGASDIRGDAAAYPRLREGQADIGCYQCWLNPVGTSLFIW